MLGVDNAGEALGQVEFELLAQPRLFLHDLAVLQKEHAVLLGAELVHLAASLGYLHRVGVLPLLDHVVGAEELAAANVREDGLFVVVLFVHIELHHFGGRLD